MNEATAFIERSQELHKEVEKILSQGDPHFMNEQMEIREDFKLDLQKLYNSVKDKIGELESLNRKIREEMGRQRVDIEKLESQKIHLYSERKRNNL